MPILVSIRRPSARQRFEQDSRWFIEQYCADHGAFLRNPKEYYRAQLHQKNPGAARGFGDDGTQKRYFSPYEDEHRFRHYEAVGGYRCAPYGNDGVAVSAKQGHTHTAKESGAESFQFVTGNRATHRPVMPQASLPNPVKVNGRWEYPDSPQFSAYSKLFRTYTNRATRFAAMRVERPMPPKHLRYDYATVDTISPARSLSTFIYGEPRGMFTSLSKMSKQRTKSRAKANRNWSNEHSLTLREYFHEYEPTDEETKSWRKAHWSTRRRLDCREGRLEPLCACPTCQKWYSNLERVDWRTVWVEESDEEGRLLRFVDVSTRKVRDFNAHLKLYRYGDHNYQPREMARVTAERLRDAIRRVSACGGQPYFWPKRETGAHFSSGSPIVWTWLPVQRKPFQGFARAHEIEKRRAEIGPALYEKWLLDNGYLLASCVFPLCTDSQDGQMTARTGCQ